MEQPLQIGLTEELDIAFEWSDFLQGATIAEFTVTLRTGIERYTSDIKVGSKVQVFVKPSEGVEAGASLAVDCRIVTNDTPPRKGARRYLLVAVGVKTVQPS